MNAMITQIWVKNTGMVYSKIDIQQGTRNLGPGNFQTFRRKPLISDKLSPGYFGTKYEYPDYECRNRLILYFE